MLKMILTGTLGLFCLFLYPGSQTNAQGQSDVADKQKIQALRKDCKDTKRIVQSGQFDEVQTSLARFGEREPLQQILCELDFGTPVVQSTAFAKLPRVGGWFSIAALSEFLADTPQNMKGRSDAYGVYVSPQIMALKILPQVVPNPPLGVANAVRLMTYDDEREQAVRTWARWLEANGSLRTLQPVGAGSVPSENVCRDVLKHDPASRAYPPINSK
jgi:hypothetical protein